MKKLTAITGFLLLIWSSCLIAAEYEFTTIAMPEAHSTRPHGINDMGDVVGVYVDCGTCPQNHAFLYSDGQYYDIGVDGIKTLVPFGINRHGVIAGTLATGGQQMAFVMDETQTHILEGAIRADGINNNPDSVVVGYRSTPKFNMAAVLWRAGNYVNLINPDQPGVIASAATGVNDRGDVVGYWAKDAGDGIHVITTGFVISGKSGVVTFTELLPLGINSSGQIVGLSGAGYDGATLDENGVVQLIKVPGADYTQVRAINNRGDIAGYYLKGGKYLGFIGKPIMAAKGAKR